MAWPGSAGLDMERWWQYGGMTYLPSALSGLHVSRRVTMIHSRYGPL